MMKLHRGCQYVKIRLFSRQNQKEELIVEIATKIHADYCEDELRDFFIRMQSIKENNHTKEENIDEKMYKYNTKDYKFVYDKSYFSVVEEENSLGLKYNLDTCFKIEVISSAKWLAKYKNYPVINVNLGNNTYYNYGNEYLIYNNGFYLITINTDSVMVKSMLLDVLSSLEFNQEDI